MILRITTLVLLLSCPVWAGSLLPDKNAGLPHSISCPEDSGTHAVHELTGLLSQDINQQLVIEIEPINEDLHFEAWLEGRHPLNPTDYGRLNRSEREYAYLLCTNDRIAAKDCGKGAKSRCTDLLQHPHSPNCDLNAFPTSLGLDDFLSTGFSQPLIARTFSAGDTPPVLKQPLGLLQYADAARLRVRFTRLDGSCPDRPPGISIRTSPAGTRLAVGVVAGNLPRLPLRQRQAHLDAVDTLGLRHLRIALRGFHHKTRVDGKVRWDRELVADTIRELNAIGIVPDIRVRISPEDYTFDQVGKFNPYGAAFSYPDVWRGEAPTLNSNDLLIEPDWPAEEQEEMRHHCPNARPRSIRYIDPGRFALRMTKYLEFLSQHRLRINSLGFFNEINSTCGNADILVRRTAYKKYPKRLASIAETRHQASADNYARLLAAFFDAVETDNTLRSYFKELKVVSFPAALKPSDAKRYATGTELLTNKIRVSRFFDAMRRTHTTSGESVYSRLHAISFNTYPRVRAGTDDPKPVIATQLGKVAGFVKRNAPEKPLWINEFGFHQYYDGRNLKGSKRPSMKRFDSYRHFLGFLIDHPELNVEKAMIFGWDHRRNPLVVDVPGSGQAAASSLLRLPESEILRYSR